MGIVYKGELNGMVTSEINMPGVFLMKLDDRIEGVPEEILTYYKSFTPFIFRKGDRVRIDGRIYSRYSKYGGKEYYILRPNNIWNETFQYGT